MTSKDIEDFAVSKIKDRLRFNKLLQPYLDSNDKTPLYDGHVNIYNGKDPNQGNESYIGWVPVQIKGKSNERKFPKEYRYPVEISALQAYQKDGGVLFFVVPFFCDKNEIHEEIYYSDLTPFKLARMLKKKKKKQKTMKIPFQIFPKDEKEIADVFLCFKTDSDKQHNRVNENILSCDDLMNSGFQIQNLKIFITECKRANPQERFDQVLLSNLFTVYTENENHEIGIPVDIVRFNEISQKKDVVVELSGKHFYDQVKVVKTKEDTKLKLGKSMTIAYPNDVHQHASLNFKPQGTLSERIRDIEFFLELANKREYVINCQKCSCHFDTTNAPFETIEEVLQNLKTIQTLFQKLRITEDFDPSGMSDSEDANLGVLIESILKNRPVSLENPKDDCKIGCIKIKNLNILVFFKKEFGTMYSISDFFRCDVPIFGENSSPQQIKFPMSQFLLLGKDDFTRVSNLDTEVIADSIISFECQDYYSNFVTNSILKMINAYDLQQTKNPHLLTCAEKILRWQMEKVPECFNFFLNYLQVQKRIHEKLAVEDIATLIERKKEVSDDYSLFGAYVLLESFQEAKYHWEKISEENRTEYEKHPIVTLWREKKP